MFSIATQSISSLHYQQYLVVLESVDIDPALVLVFRGLEVSAVCPPSFELDSHVSPGDVVLHSEVALLVLHQNAWNATGLYYLG